mmetsp:Transcript_7317/g.9305  ORF Transcript_7317/g.9305 Transcript_7317/m.9305 type:complete len:411 (-) Transcript_7317:40-1272(-)
MMSNNVHIQRQKIMIKSLLQQKRPLVSRLLSLSSSPSSSLAFSTSASASASSKSPESTTQAFDRPLKSIHRLNTIHHIPQYSYFKQEIASRLIDRLDDIIRDDGFPLALEIGSGGILTSSHDGLASASAASSEFQDDFLYKEIVQDDGYPMGGIGGIRKLVMMDSLHSSNNQNNDSNNNDQAMKYTKEEVERCSTYKLKADEEQPLPFPNDTFDLVLSSTSMHWVNDLPQLWKEIRRILKPDGCFLFAMIGGSTLSELSLSLNIAELEREGGVSSHVGPFVDFSDVGSLLSNAGFNLTTIDVDTIKLGYPNSMVLMEHLQRMGESNACLNRRRNVNVDTFLASACLYDKMYPLQDDDDDDGDDEGAIEATVQIIYGIGWVPHESQPKPKARGSATHKVGDVNIDHHSSTS